MQKVTYLVLQSPTTFFPGEMEKRVVVGSAQHPQPLRVHWMF